MFEGLGLAQVVVLVAVLQVFRLRRHRHLLEVAVHQSKRHHHHHRYRLVHAIPNRGLFFFKKKEKEMIFVVTSLDAFFWNSPISWKTNAERYFLKKKGIHFKLMIVVGRWHFGTVDLDFRWKSMGILGIYLV